MAELTAPQAPTAPSLSDLHRSGNTVDEPPQTGEGEVIHRSPSSTEASRIVVAVHGQEISAEIGDSAYATLAFSDAAERHAAIGTQRPRVLTSFTSVGGEMLSPFAPSKGRQPF